MPRKPRLLLDNVFYHVITRGNQKQSIFIDEDDRVVYLNLLYRYKNRYDSTIYGWCLMANHVHLVIGSRQLPKIMHGINLAYAIYFKNKYSKIGHFWQDRYKSFVVEKNNYAINCISYIEHNPVRAKIVLKPEDYQWSSYKARQLGKNNRLLDTLVL